MFDLNEQIKNWRYNLNASQSFEHTDIDELESHLREEIAKLTLSGLSEQEAFLVSAHRLGQVNSLSEEFAKINTGILWRKRFFWSGIVVLIWLLMNCIVNLFSHIILSIAVLVGTRGYTLSVVGNFSKVMLFVLVIFALFFIAKLKTVNNLFYRIINNFWGEIILFVAVLIIVVGSYITNSFATLICARLIGAQEYGQMAMLNSIASFAWGIFVPIVLLLVIILIRPLKLQKAEE